MYIYLFVVILLLIIYYLWNQTTDLKVYWFHNPKCEHCKEMKDEWKKIEDKLCGTGIKYKLIDITDPKYKKIKDNFNFTTVPHIVKINANGTRDVFKGKRTYDEMIAWIYDNYE